MSDDLLRELARVARERREAEKKQPWERLAEGGLSQEERQELERLAGQDPEAGRALEAFRPLDPAARERIVARLEGEARPAAPVVSLSRWRQARVAVPVMAALAAGVLLVVVPSRDPASSAPDYTLSLSGEQAVRADVPEAEVPRLGSGSRLTLLLRPTRAVRGPVEARAFLLRPGRAYPWTPPMEVSPDGAIRIQGPVQALLAGVPAGEWTLAIAVGEARALPEEPEEVARLVEAGRAPEGGKWRLLTRKFVLTDSP